jgi:hypothetical protein
MDFVEFCSDASGRWCVTGERAAHLHSAGHASGTNLIPETEVIQGRIYGRGGLGGLKM